MNGSGKIWDAAEAFRRQYLAQAGGTLPVDVFSIVELQLRLDVIPFDDLQAKYRIDAALTQDFTGMYVDTESYVFWGTRAGLEAEPSALHGGARTRPLGVAS